MDFWLNVLSGAIGSFLGILGAFGIFLIQQRSSKKTVKYYFSFRLNKFKYLINDLDGQLKMIKSSLDMDRQTNKEIILICGQLVKEILAGLEKIQPNEVPKNNFEEFKSLHDKLNWTYIRSHYVSFNKLFIEGSDNPVEIFYKEAISIIQIYNKLMKENE